MTRPIKFRAWDNGRKKWLMGYELQNLGGFDLFGECMLLGEWSAVLDAFLFERDGRKSEDLKVMQYTGLLDKSGKEIFEGDILASYEGEEMGWLQVGKVHWWKDEAKFILADRDDYSTEDENWETPSEWSGYEIIGNIYGNPELLTNSGEENSKSV